MRRKGGGRTKAMTMTMIGIKIRAGQGNENKNKNKSKNKSKEEVQDEGRMAWQYLALRQLFCHYPLILSGHLL